MNVITIHKAIIAVSAIVMAMPVFSQIPNAGFEYWKTQTSDQLQSWNTYGKAAKISNDAGGFAVRLTNQSASGDYGMLSMVQYDTGNFFAPFYAYNEAKVPDSISFLVRMQLGVDTAVIDLAFTKTGEDFPVAFSEFRLAGNAGVWQTLTFPLEYVNPTPDLAADSGYAIITSADANSGAQGSGYIDIDRITFKWADNTSGMSMPNNSFENWISTQIEYPENWVSSTQLLWLQDHSGNQTNKSSEAFAGAHAIEVKPTVTYEVSTGKPDTLPGFCISLKNGSQPEEADIFTPAFAINQRYTSFRGNMKTNLGSGDVAIVWVNIFSNGNIVGSAFYNDGTTHGYSEFSADITWDTAFTGTPDSASIGLYVSDSSMGGAKSPSVSKALFDELRFDNWNTQAHRISHQFSTVFPNPTAGQCYVKLNSSVSDKATLELRSLNGRLLNTKEIAVTGSQNIPVFDESFAPGTYILRVKQGSTFSIHKITLTQ